jgi:hypothetical protein
MLDPANPSGTSVPEGDSSASASAQTETPAEQQGGSYNPFDGEVVSEKGTSEPFSASGDSTGGVEIKRDMDWDQEGSADTDPGSPNTTDRAGDEKPKKKKKKRSDSDAPHDSDEYEIYAEAGIDILDVLQDFATHWKLDKHVANETIHPDALDRFVQSLALTIEEKKKLRKPVARVMEHEKIRVDPWTELAMIAGVIATPRVQAVRRLDKQLVKMKAEGVSIGKNEKIHFRGGGEDSED